jgi:glycosyltransferase involved in cell wall biosynthesis
VPADSFPGYAVGRGHRLNEEGTPVTIWLDVEDLFEYAVVNGRPSGIQRLSFELYRALIELRGEGDTRFCRHDTVEPTLVTVEWAELAALYARLTAEVEAPEAEADAEAQPGAPAVPAPMVKGPFSPVSLSGPIRQSRRLVEFLPLRMRAPLSQMAQHQKAALRFAFALLKSIFVPATAPAAPSNLLPASSPIARIETPHAPHHDPKRLIGRDIRDLAKPGDILLVLGSPWFRADHGKIIGDLRASLQLRVGILIYDLIPILHPEWCDRYLVKMFRDWYYETVPHVDAFFAISNATVRDMINWADREGMTLRGSVSAIPIGTGFTEDKTKPRREGDLPAGLEAGSYILFVSTIEARKNHMLAFRVWRRLLATMPRDQVPTLVFAGRVGWLVADLMQQIANANHLDGKLMVLEEVDDGTLSALYRGCRFSLFPSLYEGWGLPVTESLGYGKVCIASNRASVPEAGGDFCQYFDPDDLNDAVETIRRAIENPAEIRALEARIATEFRPTSWIKAAEQLLKGVEEPR